MDLNEEINLIYKFSRFFYDQSPSFIYLPSPSLLFQMMKACLGIKNPE